MYGDLVFYLHGSGSLNNITPLLLDPTVKCTGKCHAMIRVNVDGGAYLGLWLRIKALKLEI